MKPFQLWGKINVEILLHHKKLRLALQSNAYLWQHITPFMVNSTSCERPRFKWDMGGSYGTVTWQCYHINMKQDAFEDSCNLPDPWEDRSNQSPWAQMCPGSLEWHCGLGGRQGIAHSFFSVEWHSWPVQIRASAAPSETLLLLQSPRSAWFPHLPLG